MGGQQLVGREFIGEMMVYPIQQKELYLEPYISMLKELNLQLKSKSQWIIIGYSFNDPVIREIFIKNSDKQKKIVFLHPNADTVLTERLPNIKYKKVSPLNLKFGADHFKEVNYTIVNKFKERPILEVNDNP